jgi:CubicO group peptidase (beta-lactamase class C family)
MKVDTDRLARVESRIASDIEAGIYDGAALVVHHQGECILRSVQGYRCRKTADLLGDDAVFATFSSGKQMTVVAVLQAVEKGLLHLHTPVVDVIPEFGVNGKTKINLGHLLSHTGGVVSMPPPMPPEAMGNLQDFVSFICNTAPESRPGERVRYSITPAHALMAEMVRRVDGGEREFRQIVREDIFEPIGMHDTALGLPDELRPRLCPIVVVDRSPGLLDPDMLEMFNEVLAPETEIPAGGYVTTIDDFGAFAQMLCNGGELNDARILSPATLDCVTRNVTGDMPNDIWDYAVESRNWPVFPAYLGLGFFLRGEGPHPTPFGSLATPRTFGGVGAGSTTFFIDPEKGLSYAFLSTGLLEESRSTERHQYLADLVHGALT